MAKYSDCSESKKAGDWKPIQRTQPWPCISRSMGAWKGVLRRKGVQMLDMGHACTPPPDPGDRLHLLQDLARRIGARQARDIAAGMGAGPAEPEARDRHAVLLIARRRGAGRTSGPGSPRRDATGRRSGRIAPPDPGASGPPAATTRSAQIGRASREQIEAALQNLAARFRVRRLAQAIGRVLRTGSRRHACPRGAREGSAKVGMTTSRAGCRRHRAVFGRSRRRARHDRSRAPARCARRPRPSSRAIRRGPDAAWRRSRSCGDGGCAWRTARPAGPAPAASAGCAADRRWRRRWARGSPRRRRAPRRPRSPSRPGCARPGHWCGSRRRRALPTWASASVSAPMPPMGRCKPPMPCRPKPARR